MAFNLDVPIESSIVGKGGRTFGGCEELVRVEYEHDYTFAIYT